MNFNTISLLSDESLGRIFSQVGNELGASSFPARNELSMFFPYTLFPAGNELVLKLTKNTASYLWKPFLCPVESADDEAEPAVADLVREPDQHRRVRLHNNALGDEHLEIHEFH